MSSWRDDVLTRGLLAVQEDAPRLIKEMGDTLAAWSESKPSYEVVYDYATNVRGRTMVIRAAMFAFLEVHSKAVGQEDGSLTQVLTDVDRMLRSIPFWSAIADRYAQRRHKIPEAFRAAQDKSAVAAHTEDIATALGALVMWTHAMDVNMASISKHKATTETKSSMHS